MIYAQMTPIPAHFPKNEATPEVTAFMDGESSSFQEWAGIDREQIIADILPGFEHSFLLLRSKTEDAKLLDKYYAFRSELSGDVVAGDVGCIQDGQCFANRCRWTFAEGSACKKRGRIAFILCATLVALAVVTYQIYGLIANETQTEILQPENEAENGR